MADAAHGPLYALPLPHHTPCTHIICTGMADAAHGPLYALPLPHHTHITHHAVKPVARCALRLVRCTQGAPKKKKKKGVPTCLFLRFFEIFRSDFRKYFYGVFGLPMQRNGQKRD
jgi:hypothetical protein